MTTENIANIEEMDIDAEMAALEAELGGFDDADEILLDDPTDTVHEEDDLEAAVADIKMEEAKAEAYEAQEAGEDDTITDPIDVAVAAPKKKAIAPRKTMTGAKKSEVVKDKLGANAETMLELTTGEVPNVDAVLKSIDEMAVKVGEKAVNLLTSLNSGSPDKISVYVLIAFKFLKSKNEMVVKDSFDHYVDQKANGVKGYGEGTARSQSHQMFNLFPQLKIGVMNGKIMSLNTDSALVAKLEAALIK